MCRLLRWKETAQTRAVMTIREKFADPKFLVSKYKDELMVLHRKDFQQGRGLRLHLRDQFPNP